ncbi:MAG: response regulator [Kiritimatiellae bacterium]|nr:response regulator [Kiritimatiellia bacterium]
MNKSAIPTDGADGDLSVATILVVDDDPANLSVMSDYLKDFDYRVIVARDGESALARAEYGKPDLILLDVLMPKMDGYETCRLLKAREGICDIPVIFMTALAETSDKVAAFQAGGVDYVTKPFQQEEVLARVQVQLKLRRQKRELERSYAALKRLEELRDRLVHMVIHDMRTPLWAVRELMKMLI